MISTSKLRLRLVLFLILLSHFPLSTSEDVLETTTTPRDDNQAKGGKSALDRLEDLKQSFMKGWYQLTNGFLDLVDVDFEALMESVSEIIVAVTRREGRSLNEVIPKTVKKTAKANTGIVACLVVGGLYVVVMLVLLILLPCCRMCFNLCGGKRSQVVTKSTDRWRIVNIVILVFIVGVLATACTSMFVSSGSVYTTLGESSGTISDSLNLVINYTDQVAKDLNDTSIDPLEKVQTSISKRIYATRDKVRKEFYELTGLNMAEKFKQDLRLDELISEIPDLETKLSDRKDITSNLKSLNEKAEKIKKECKEDPCQNIVTDFGNVEPQEVTFDVNGLNDTRRNLDKVDEEIKQIDDKITEKFDAAKEDLDNNIASQNKQMKDFLKKLKDDISKVANRIRTFTKSRFPSQNKENNKKAFDKQLDFRQYTLGSMIGVAAIPTILAVGLLLGLMCGVCGHNKKRQPDERKSLSHCGGVCLIISVYFFLFFAALLMVLTMALFLVGGASHWYVCGLIKDNSLEKMDMVVDFYRNYSNQSSDVTFDLLKPGTILRKCQKNQPLLRVINISLFNITGDGLQEKLDEYIQKTRDQISFSDEFDDNIDTMKTTLKEFNKKRDKLEEELNKLNELKKIKESIVLVKEKLEKVTTTNFNITGPKEVKDDIESFVSEAKLTYGSVYDLKNKLDIMTTLGDSVKAAADRVKEEVSEIEKKLDTGVVKKMENITKEELENFNFKVDDIANETLGNIGQCYPIYEVFTMLSVLVCDLLVDPANGYTIGLGTCLIFFIPTMIVALKLSKHYLRVKPKYRGVRHGHDSGRDTIELSDMKNKPRRPTGMVNNAPDGGHYRSGNGKNHPNHY